MPRVAIFVDAGYLFAQGSVALTGGKAPRSETKLNETAVLAELVAVANARCDGVRLLRTYWYDAPLGPRMSVQHAALANADHVKLRLGAMNGQGQQKGVDSLIVTDLIELARNKSICDAILLSGDEDVRIGVQIAQNFGVAVHLIGIHPSRGSQSAALRQEADTNTEWDKDLISRFLTVSGAVKRVTLAVEAPAPAKGENQPKPQRDERGKVHTIVEEMVAAFDSNDLNTLEKYWASGERGIPADIDGPLLGRCRDALGRALTPEERRQARHFLSARVKALIAKSGS